MSDSNPVMIVGLGYVGLPLAMAFLDGGRSVLGIDTSIDKLRALRSGSSYIDGIDDEVVAKHIQHGDLIVSSEPSVPGTWDAAVIAVPTPLDENRLPDLSAVRAAARMIAKTLRPGCLVVLESTTYPGTTREVLVPILEEVSGLVAGTEFFVAFSPERVDPGNPRFGIANTPKLVGAINGRSLEAAERLYESAVDQVVAVSSPEVAELSKLLENTYRHVNIALVNELAIVAHELDIDVWEVVQAAATKPYGFQSFRPGPGVGGHCLPIDPAYLSWRVKSSLNRSFRFIELATEVNDLMPSYVVQRLLLACNDLGHSLASRRVAVLGVTYKANVADARESPAMPIVDTLVRLGAIPVLVDPHVDPRNSDSNRMADWSAETMRSVDLAVLVTDHDCFVEEQELLSEVPFILDTRGVLDRSAGNVHWL